MAKKKKPKEMCSYRFSKETQKKLAELAKRDHRDMTNWLENQIHIQHEQLNSESI